MSNAIAKAAATALAGAALLAAGAAQAQSNYPAPGQGPGAPGYNYDPCRRDANQRGATGDGVPSCHVAPSKSPGRDLRSGGCAPWTVHGATWFHGTAESFRVGVCAVTIS